MESKFEKNFTDQGYLLNYEKPQSFSFLKNQVFQFKIELSQIFMYISYPKLTFYS